MPAPLPLIPTSVVGSSSPTAWLAAASEAIARGEFGPSDVEETLTDAVRLAVLDQVEAGVDVITDGEMRRQDFNLGFYDRLRGLRPQPPRRKQGPEGHDQRGRWDVLEPVTAPEGLGIVEEFRYLKSLGDYHLKATCPGPFTLAGRLATGTVYADRIAATEALVPIVNAELQGLVAAGATFIQLDEPSYAVYPDRPRLFVDVFNRTVEGVQAKIGIHMCFGNFRGRPVGKRSYRPLFPHIFDLNAHQFVLEFANREMAEIELWREFPSDRELGAGLVDVKSYYVETPEDVAGRIRLTLRHGSPERLTVLPDCGFSQTARWAELRKLRSMVIGTQIVRRELGG